MDAIRALLDFSRRITPEITLAALKEEDAGALFALVDANRSHLLGWLPWLDDTRNAADTLAFIQAARRDAADRVAFKAAIWVSSELAGVAGFNRIDWSNRIATIGYWLGEPYQGRGLMTQCCQALIDHAFAALNMNRVVIACAVENARSRAIPVRLGFQHEGTLREAEWLYPRYVDHAIYGLLQQEWRTRVIARAAGSA